jgi:hypothetical protein
MLCSVVTLDHHSRLFTSSRHTLLSRCIAFASAHSRTGQNAICTHKRPLFSHTYTHILPQPPWIDTDTNCRVPTPLLSTTPRRARILLLIYNKQVKGDAVTLPKKPLKCQKKAYIASIAAASGTAQLTSGVSYGGSTFGCSRSEHKENYR